MDFVQFSIINRNHFPKHLELTVTAENSGGSSATE